MLFGLERSAAFSSTEAAGGLVSKLSTPPTTQSEAAYSAAPCGAVEIIVHLLRTPDSVEKKSLPAI